MLLPFLVKGDFILAWGGLIGLIFHLYLTYITDRSGTEEEYSELQQLCEDIVTFRRDMAETKEKEKEAKKRKDEDDRKKAEEMRRAAVDRLAST